MEKKGFTADDLALINGVRVDRAGEEAIEVIAVPETKPVEPTGGGDALRAGFVAAGVSPALADGLAALGPSEVVIKLGRRGATARIDGELIEVPAVPVQAIDTVGAGDAFVAGYLADRLAGADAGGRLATAIAAGAFAVTVPGDCEGLADRAELAALTGGDIRR